MPDNKIDVKDVRLYTYLLLNSPEINEILNKDYIKRAKENTTPTFYTNDSFYELVFRLLLNKDFENEPDEIKTKLIYTDYYPESARTSFAVYMDDRRNLCQEFHNRLCAEFKIPRTSVRFLEFTEDIGQDKEYFYDCYNNAIYINTKEKFHTKSNSHLLEMVTRGTYLHKLQIMISNYVKKSTDYSEAEKYVCYSTLLKQTVLVQLSEEKYFQDREALENSDEFCSADVYAIYNAYNYLEQVFDKVNLIGNPLIGDFEEDRMSFMASLTACPDEEIMDCEYDEESGELTQEGNFSTSILDDTIDYDFSLLSELKNCHLNKYTNNDLFDIFMEKLDEYAPDFYGYLGSELGDDFAGDFECFEEDDEEDDEEVAEFE